MFPGGVNTGEETIIMAAEIRAGNREVNMITTMPGMEEEAAEEVEIITITSIVVLRHHQQQDPQGIHITMNEILITEVTYFCDVVL